MKIIITWLLFVGVIAVNALANILPINGYNTGQISAFYPNAFVPAGFTFSIWGVIYLLLLSYTIGYTYFSLKRQAYPKAYRFIEHVNTYFLLTCIFNMAWIVAWHYLQIELSVLIMLLFLSTLIQLFLKTKSMAHDLNLIQRFILQTPFIVYLGWISVATIANITALLVAYKWTALSIAPVYWSAAMILIAIVLAAVMLIKFKVVPFALVVAWALWGIYNAQGPAAPILARLTAIGIGVLVSAVLFRFIQNLRENSIFKKIAS
jgi:benzodiazapine receptor